MARLLYYPRHHDQRWRRFGRRARAFVLGASPTKTRPAALSDDIRLFGLTFVGGFLFMSVYLA